MLCYGKAKVNGSSRAQPARRRTRACAVPSARVSCHSPSLFHNTACTARAAVRLTCRRHENTACVPTALAIRHFHHHATSSGSTTAIARVCTRTTAIARPRAKRRSNLSGSALAGDDMGEVGGCGQQTTQGVFDQLCIGVFQQAFEGALLVERETVVL